MTTRSKVTFASISQHQSNTKANLTRTSLALFLGFSLINSNVAISADAAINRAIPNETNQNYKISPGPLGVALSMFASQSKVLLSFDPTVTDGKTSAGLNGSYNLNDGFKLLLKGSGLTVVSDQKGGYQLEKLPVVKSEQDLPLNAELSAVEVRAKRFYEVGPLHGLGLTKNQIPGNVQSVTAKEIKESRALNIADLLNTQLQSVNVNDYQGNPFQMDVQYRGFTASPQIGTPQGLSVFFDGIRVNEPFGDVVNWDMIPMNALAGLDVFPGSNPIFGLGTLGGAFSMKTKDGFTHEGADVDVLTGSFGRKQLQVSSGWNNGTVALFGAGIFFLEDGWRENSPSRVNQFFGKASYRGDKLDLNLSTLIVGNDLVGNGLIPSEQYAQNRNGVFTSPDTTDNRLLQFQLSGDYFVNDNFNVTGQVYRRKSKRHQVGSDVYTEYGNSTAIRNMDAGDQYTCLYNSTNRYALPDYYVATIPGGDVFAYLGPVAQVQFGDPADPLYASYLADPNYQIYQSNNQVKFVVDYFLTGTTDVSLVQDTFNQNLPDYYAKYAQYNFNYYKNYRASVLYTPQGNVGNNTYNPPNPPPAITSPSGETAAYQYQNIAYSLPTTPGITQSADVLNGLTNYYYTNNSDGTVNLNMIITQNATNAAACAEGQTKYVTNGKGGLADVNPDGTTNQYDGAQFGGTGLVKGVPTAVITDTQIDQMVDGASVQFNWSFEHHKFMIGASIDSASAEYGSGQRLGFFDANRKAYLDPDQALDGLLAADYEIRNNDFDGISATKSIYASETWSPIETVHITGAARYNTTKIQNKVASRAFGFSVADLHKIIAEPDLYNICRTGQPCPTGYRLPEIFNLVNPPETEKFSYYSLNPSLGATWQAKENLNLYSNWSQGTRTPSVIELGCALDKTLVPGGLPIDTDGDGIYDTPGLIFKSISENRSCSMPSTLSGDPYLPQIKATTYDVGMRGSFESILGAENLVWNLGAYRTNLKDDIYLVTFPGNRNFFDTIGKTRRQGIEAGVSGNYGKLGFKLNYALTDATFQDSFEIASNDNSSSFENTNLTEEGEIPTRSIKVKPGNRMPGVPLHNLNATISYALTPKWSIGVTGVMHSESFIRGNENNEHRKGVTTFVTFNDPVTNTIVTLPRQPTNNPGKVPGFATFNFQTRYQFNSEWSMGLQVNNIFDKEYFSAGRLGRNPFSPSINGAIGPDGYNHNSFDWQSTNFVAPGAPRAAWFSINWQFDPNKK